MAEPEDSLNFELAAEAQDVVDTLGQALLAASQAAGGATDPQNVSAMFRAAHTLKGIASMMGLTSMAGLAHGIEDALEAWRMGRLTPDDALLAALLHSLESCEAHLGAVREALEDTSALDIANQQAALRLEAVVHRTSDPAGEAVLKDTEVQKAIGAVTQADSSPENAARLAESVGLSRDEIALMSAFELLRVEKNLSEGRQVFLGRARFLLTSCSEDMAYVDQTLSPLCEIIAKVPVTDAAQDDRLVFDFVLGSALLADRLQDAIALSHIDWRICVPTQALVSNTEQTALSASPPSHSVVPQEPLVTAQTTAMTPVRPQGVTKTPEAMAENQGLVRVDVQRLDKLLHLTSELSRTREVLLTLGAELRGKQGLRGVADTLLREGRQLERRMGELRHGIMATRMVPIGRSFERLVRAGVKVARELGLDVAFRVEGERVELDKIVVEELAEPLLHLVRNAVDHGIEPEDVRRAAKKSHRGTIVLRAEARGSHVLVEVCDDGCGVDAKEVAQEAIRKNLIDAQTAQSLSERETLALLWLPGFSTRREVSAYSGRGVGLDVVRTRLEALGGSVDIATHAGVGTTFTLMAPITLSTLPSLLVEGRKGTWGLPVAHVVETLAVGSAELTAVQGRPMMAWRGAWLPLVTLDAWVEASGFRQAASHTLQEHVAQTPYAVIVAAGERRLAVLVAGLKGRQDVLNKTLGPRLKHVRGLAGAAELPNREVILVLDPPSLLEAYFAGARALTQGAAI